MDHHLCKLKECDICFRQAARIAAKSYENYDEVKYAYYPPEQNHLHIVVDRQCVICQKQII